MHPPQSSRPLSGSQSPHHRAWRTYEVWASVGSISLPRRTRGQGQGWQGARNPHLLPWKQVNGGSLGSAVILHQAIAQRPRLQKPPGEMSARAPPTGQLGRGQGAALRWPCSLSLGAREAPHSFSPITHSNTQLPRHPGRPEENSSHHPILAPGLKLDPKGRHSPPAVPSAEPAPLPKRKESATCPVHVDRCAHPLPGVGGGVRTPRPRAGGSRRGGAPAGGPPGGKPGRPASSSPRGSRTEPRPAWPGRVPLKAARHAALSGRRRVGAL